jgi:hypothetical protein
VALDQAGPAIFGRDEDSLPDAPHERLPDPAMPGDLDVTSAPPLGVVQESTHRPALVVRRARLAVLVGATTVEDGGPLIARVHRGRDARQPGQPGAAAAVEPVGDPVVLAVAEDDDRRQVVAVTLYKAVSSSIAAVDMLSRGWMSASNRSPSRGS